MKKSAALLSYINATVSASSEQDVDYLLKIMSPSNDRDEMGKLYDEILGYNPITHFDKEDIRSMLKKCEEKAPDPVATTIKQQEDYIINETLAKYNEGRDNRLAMDLCNVIKNITGWLPDINELIPNGSRIDEDGDGFEDDSYDEELFNSEEEFGDDDDYDYDGDDYSFDSYDDDNS